MSPKKKKPRISNQVPGLKRENNTIESPNKRRKSENNKTEDLQSLRRKNFIKACELVSYKSYTNHAERFRLVYLPHCISSSVCKHEIKDKSQIKPVPNNFEEIFKIEMKSNMWSEALEVCHLCISPSQYLSSDILKDIVEIMMNAHEDSSMGCSISHLVNQCQQVLGLNFSTHPPCLMKSVRKCYESFLTSPMDLKENTFSNRREFECKEGLVKYCMNRLEYEISAESKDEPLVNKYENIPEDMKQSVKGLHWQKEKLEIFELLERTDRIERLMAVLHSVIELLQFDLAIWHSRYTNNLGNHIMRSHKPLMAYVLWSNNVLYTGAVNKNCSQIFRIFAYMIHLQYPEEHIKIMTLWLNTVIQTFYICENNSNIDYPNTGKYCAAFASKFYAIVKELPHNSIIKILERIKPAFMKHLIGMIHIQTLLQIDCDNCIQILINLLDESEWTKFPDIENNFLVKKTVNIKNIKPNKFLKLLSQKCKQYNNKSHTESTDLYPKMLPCETKCSITRDSVFRVIYLTFQAYLDAFSVLDVQEKLDLMNEQLENGEMVTEEASNPAFYVVSEHFIKKNRLIFQLIKELVVTLNNIQDIEELSAVKKMFGSLLGL